MADKNGKELTGNPTGGNGYSNENPYGGSFDALLEAFSDVPAGISPDYAAMAPLAPAVIGWVRSPLHRLEDCPRSPEDAPEAVLEILPEYVPCLLGLHSGQKIVLLTWLHLADRSVRQVRGRQGDGELRGVFCCRSPMRPNPIGLHEAVIAEIDAGAASVRVRVKALEALDGTPILDIKDNTPREKSLANFVEGRKNLAEVCTRAHGRGLLSGFNGNASLRLGSRCLITRSGALKSCLTPNDFAVLEIETGELLEGSSPSSEAGAHLHIYRSQPKARAVLHTHPPKMLALGLRFPDQPMKDRLAMEVYEADPLRAKLGTTPRFSPGSEEIAVSAGLSAIHNQAIWLEGHGLCVWAGTLPEALGLSEELEHLAGVRLNGGKFAQTR